MLAGTIRTKHLRSDPPEPSDGTRILITRYYPRGIGKDAGLWSEWIRELAPSAELHGAVKSGAIGWAEYEKRFRIEMRAPTARAKLAELDARARSGETLTLLCDHPKTMAPAECHRFLIARWIASPP